jgi:hypothetical protein
MAVTTKSKTYYTTRTVVRFIFRVIVLLTAYVVLHVVASSIWNTLLFFAVIACGILIYDNKTKQSEEE